MRLGRWFRFRIRTLLIAIGVLGLALGVAINWEYLPGTFYIDNNGDPHGTGKDFGYYHSGELRIVEWYRAGVVTKQTFYRPDGEEVITSTFDKKQGGVGYTLYDDGTIRTKIPFRFIPEKRDYLAHGKGLYYAPDGTVEKEIEFHNGVRIKETPVLKNPEEPLLIEADETHSGS